MANSIAIDECLMEVRQYTGPGYMPLVDFGAWRVAVLNYLKENQPHLIDKFERHLETDEVFVLLHGQAVLLIGEGEDEVERIFFQPMEMGKVYNIKARTWHSILMSLDASVLVIENRDTDEKNTNYIELEVEHRQL
ncbi:MAG TPA: hypothetical protein VN376_05295, partial [Longilinea sp.]|nr:hypothetical protein [Longilinea sp.]